MIKLDFIFELKKPFNITYHIFVQQIINDKERK